MKVSYFISPISKRDKKQRNIDQIIIHDILIRD